MSSRTRIKKTSPPNGRPFPWLWVLVGGGLLLIIAAVVIGLSGSGGASGTPKLTADQQEVNLGDVKLGQPVTVSFTLTNTGDGPLTFTKEPVVQVVEGC